MQQLNRFQPPAFKPVTNVQLPTVDIHTLDNQLKAYSVNIGQQEAIRIECLFLPTDWMATQPLRSFFAAKMLTEGTLTKTASYLSEVLDGYGAFTEIIHSADQLGIAIYCIPRFLPQVLPLVSEMLSSSNFPIAEWDELVNITLQQLRVNKEQNAWLASSYLRAAVFGTDTSYGYTQQETDLNTITRENAFEYYEQYLKHSPFTIFVAGKVNEQNLTVINQTLGQSLRIQSTPTTPVLFGNWEAPSAPIHIEKEQSVQTSIRLGRRMFTRKHADYFKMLVTSELLGGYFGSRLMKNIREEKGLTYSISSQMPVMKHSGYFVIGADVKKEFAQQTVDEIHKEIHALQTIPVSEDELQLVQNIMAGDFARSLSTAFEVADRQRITVINELPMDYYHHYLERVRAVTVSDIQEMATRYLKPEDLAQITVG